ncbi:DUF1376 domain-containing protein [Pseudomonas sp. NBRC 100443]|uniref:DUF1376 domain-containing protein n=1 Tax=Pseudomonas sp. NBRC 100443 TaxID=1113665 RepID=UPI0024A42556|nr:DUF1376 domain-containing protein [Pseudomonas sp. NBRC 100443]GLU37157.1 hypothetical protein Pssp01_12500 [Pseudomonas sp. NBRC 100443]
MSLPDPFTPADCDLRGLPFMPLDVNRLRDSDLAIEATGDEFRAAVLLWCASWNQVPAGSLPNADATLAAYAGYGRTDLKGWRKVREGALRGFVECSDGRLYHPVVAEKALEAWAERLEYREGKAAENERKRRERDARQAMFAWLRERGVVLPWNIKTKELRDEVSRLGGDESVTGHAPVTVTGHALVTAKKGQGQGQGQGQGKEPPLPPEGEAAGAAGDQDEPAPKSVRKKRDAAFDPLTAKPDNVSAEAWAKWVQHRREIRKPLTPTSCSQQAAKLADHPNPDAVILESVTNGWTGLFPDKDGRPPGAKPSNFTNLPKHTPDMYQEEPDHDGPNF